MNQSALKGGEGARDDRALGRKVEVGVQSRTGGPKPKFDRYKIGYTGLNDGIDECGFSCRDRVKPGWAICYRFQLRGNLFFGDIP